MIATPARWASLREGWVVAAFPVGIIVLGLAPVEDGPTLCPFALVTGTACPGCGMTRALSALIRGDGAEAMAYHPLAPLILFLLSAAWVATLLRRGGRLPPLPRLLVPGTLLATASLLVVVWLARLASGTLPPV